MLEKKKLPPLAKKRLRVLRAEGVNPTDEELVWLVDLARALDEVPEDYNPASFAVYAGRCPLYPLTIAGRMWLFEIAAPALDGFDSLINLALPFALAHGKKVDLLKSLTDPGQIAAAIDLWATGLDCTESELIAAADRIMPTDPLAIPGESKPTKWGEVCAMLSSQVGGSPAYWMDEASFSQVEDGLKELDRISRMGVAAAGGNPGQSPYEDGARITRALIHASKQIAERCNNESGDSPIEYHI